MEPRGTELTCAVVRDPDIRLSNRASATRFAVKRAVVEVRAQLRRSVTTRPAQADVAYRGLGAPALVARALGGLHDACMYFVDSCRVHAAAGLVTACRGLPR